MTLTGLTGPRLQRGPTGIAFATPFPPARVCTRSIFSNNETWKKHSPPKNGGSYSPVRSAFFWAAFFFCYFSFGQAKEK